MSIHYLVRLPHQVSLPNSVGLPHIVRPTNFEVASFCEVVSSGEEALFLEAVSITV